MTNVNFHKVMIKLLDKLDKDNPQKLLLHACCAPCSSYVLELLSEYFDITLFYYNPNIYPVDEFEKRRDELSEYYQNIAYKHNIDMVSVDHDANEFYNYIKGNETEPEGGKRCFLCYRQRMERASIYAKENGYDYFTTVLSISPHKNANEINKIGSELEGKYGVKFLYADFKKNSGFKRSTELSAKYNLYRQDYCGCKFSYDKRRNK